MEKEELTFKAYDYILKKIHEDDFHTKIVVINSNGQQYIRLKELPMVLGYTEYLSKASPQVNNWLRDIGKRENFDRALKKFTLNVKIHKGEHANVASVAANKEGIAILLAHVTYNKKRYVPDFKKWLKDTLGWKDSDFNIVDARPQRKESNFIGSIQIALAWADSKTQVKMGDYSVDLYFPKYKLVVECDENNHRDRDPTKEKERQTYITEKHSCKFYRFDPDKESFDIFVVIGEIGKILFEKQFETK